MNWYNAISRLLRRYGRAGRGIMQTGVGAGLRFDAATSNPNYVLGANELPVQQALAQHLTLGATFYDVGANVGFLTVIAARLVGPTGTVYAFEPVPDNAAVIRRNASENGFQNVQVIERAIANRSGVGELALAAYSGGAVLAEVATPPDWAGTMRVKLSSIDDLVELERLKPPSFVKIDVEGAELSVLEGMERTIACYRPVILYEIDDAKQEALQRKQVSCNQWVLDRGYRVDEMPASYVGIGWLVKHFIATPIECVQARKVPASMRTCS